MIRFLPLFCIVAVFCISGCSKSSDDNPNITFSLDNELFIVLWEDLAPDQRNFALQFSTIENQDCQDTEIDYSFIQEDHSIALSINSLLPPDNCIDVPEPAQAIISLGELSTKVYDIQINLKEEIINQGTLAIHTDRYEINMETMHGIDFKDKTLFRIPDHTYWGYIAYESAYLSQAESFMGEIAAMANNRTYSQGDYGHFMIDQQGKVELGIDTSLPQYQTFIFSHSDERSALEGLLEEYRTSFNQNLDIRIFSYQGVEL